MSELEFSRFDNVLSPVIALSPDFRLLYANRLARGIFPLLSARGVSLYFSEETLCSVKARLAEGQAVTLSADLNAQGSVVFEPVFRCDGTVSHILLYVESENPIAAEQFYFNDGEKFLSLQREMAEPLCDLISFLNTWMEVFPPNLRTELQVMLRRLLSGVAVLCKEVEAPLGSGIGMEVCDADTVLRTCAENFPAIVYEPTSPFFIPLNRSRATSLFVDLLSCVVLFSDKKAKVEICSEVGERETSVSLRFVCRPAPALAEEERRIVGNAVFAVNHCISRVGGLCKVSFDGMVRVHITFPRICFTPDCVTVGDPMGDSMSASVRLALDCLRMLAVYRED